jgi:hypothetical protein
MVNDIVNLHYLIMVMVILDLKIIIIRCVISHVYYNLLIICDYMMINYRYILIFKTLMHLVCPYTLYFMFILSKTMFWAFGRLDLEVRVSRCSSYLVKLRFDCDTRKCSLSLLFLYFYGLYALLVPLFKKKKWNFGPLF